MTGIGLGLAADKRVAAVILATAAGVFLAGAVVGAVVCGVVA